ncbi:MAG: hypothetical protein CL693_20285 [Cellvibrionaceae bacterium]|nr:hypothetical protein [Cellvibrionaceae bacterium]|tara:strand:+ start:34319 stop:35341 length:1023 start_codon:yes stop_codon:yes gene_type:complete
MSYLVRLEPFAVEFPCQDDETVLEAAFKAGLSMRHGCKHGGCGACKVQVVEGYVEHNDHATAISEEEIDSDIALLCCALPEEDLVLQLSDDYSEQELTPEFPVAQYTVTLEALNWVTHDIAHVVMRCNTDQNFKFSSGQYLEVSKAEEGQWRAFSMANADGDSRLIELLIKQIPSGYFSHYLKNEAKPGDALEIRGPYGQFGVVDTHAPIIMIAGGSGMAPIMSMLRQLAAEKSLREIVFFYGARTQRDLFWGAQIRSLAADLENFNYYPALSNPEDDLWAGEVGLITDVVRRITPESLRNSEGYLCGPPGMIDAAVDVLKDKGMFSSRIRFDKFLTTAG